MDWDEWLKDQEWEMHTMQMLAVLLVLAIIAVPLYFVWLIGL